MLDEKMWKGGGGQEMFLVKLRHICVGTLTSAVLCVFALMGTDQGTQRPGKKAPLLHSRSLLLLVGIYNENIMYFEFLSAEQRPHLGL